MFEGRGFKFQGDLPGNSTAKFGDVALIVAFIGIFNDVSPTQIQVEVFDAFLEQSVRRDMIVKKFTLLLADELVLSKPVPRGLLDFLSKRSEFYQSSFLFSASECIF